MTLFRQDLRRFVADEMRRPSRYGSSLYAFAAE